VTGESNERLDRIEANLDRLTALILQTAERQSAAEHQIDKILVAVAADGENIRALARIADARQRRMEGLEQGEA
jgi:hypothetical protein